MGRKSSAKNKNRNKKTEIPLCNFMKAVENSSDGIAMADSKGRHYYHNSAFEKLFGYSIKDIPKMESLGDIYVDRKKGEEVFKTVINGGEWEGEVKMASKTGKIIHVHLRAYSIKDDEENASHLVGVHTDISEKKRYVEFLKNERNQLLSIFESINEPVYVSDMDSYEVLFVNRALRKNLSKNPIGCKCYKEFQGLDSPCSFCTNEIIKNTYPESHRWEYYNPKINRIFYLHDRMFVWPDGRYVRLEIAFDITERKKAEEELRESEENLRITLESIGDAVIATDISGRIIRMNPVAEKLTGYSFSEAQGEDVCNVFRIFNSNTEKIVESPVKKVLETGEIVGLANHTILVSKNGRQYQISDSGAPIKSKAGDITGVVLVFRDISEEYSMREQLKHAQKLDALGVLAGGIAHDFNNLLGGIYGYIDLARIKTKEPIIEQYLNDSMDTMTRAQGLTHQLLTFAKGGTPHRSVDKLFPFIKKTSKFALSGSNVSCDFHVEEELYLSNYDKTQIAQVVDNLILNAKQAMPEGGKIEVSAKNIKIENKHPSLPKGNYVEISIKDRGPGIPADIRSRIFEPFFTTKSKGQGLGLSTSYSIISRHGGHLEFDSSMGEGSTFKMLLPACDETKVSVESIKEIRPHKGSGTFILMDDEKVIRETVSYMLESFGYKVVSVEDGDKAVECFKKLKSSNENLTAMIFDLTVPGKAGGIEAVKEIRKIDTEIPVFVSTGYADVRAVSNPAEYGFTAGIRKPFILEKLSEMLNVFLDSLR